MISPCFVKQGWRQLFTLGYSSKKYPVFEVRLEKAIIIFAFLKDLCLLEIISFVMLANVDDFELFVERKNY